MQYPYSSTQKKSRAKRHATLHNFFSIFLLESINIYSSCNARKIDCVAILIVTSLCHILDYRKSRNFRYSRSVQIKHGTTPVFHIIVPPTKYQDRYCPRYKDHKIDNHGIDPSILRTPCACWNELIKNSNRPPSETILELLLLTKSK